MKVSKEKREAMKSKLEYNIKQDFYRHWRYRELNANKEEGAINQMKKELKILKQLNPNSKYICILQDFIQSKEKLVQKVK